MVGLQNHDLVTTAQPLHQASGVTSLVLEASCLRYVETEPRDTDVDVPHALVESPRRE